MGRQDETRPHLLEFREETLVIHSGDRLEFVDDDDDLGARRRVGNRHLLAYGKVDVIHDDCAQESPRVGTDDSRCRIHQENAAFIQQLAEVDRRTRLPYNAANRRVGRETVNLGLNRVDDIDLQILIHPFKVAAPPLQDVVVLHVIFQEAMAKVAQFEQRQNVEERKLLLTPRGEDFIHVKQRARRIP